MFSIHENLSSIFQKCKTCCTDFIALDSAADCKNCVLTKSKSTVVDPGIVVPPIILPLTPKTGNDNHASEEIHMEVDSLPLIQKKDVNCEFVEITTQETNFLHQEPSNINLPESSENSQNVKNNARFQCASSAEISHRRNQPTIKDIQEYETINKLLKNNYKYCKHDCGVFASLFDLRTHEASCFKCPLPARCYIGTCTWQGTMQTLVPHVSEGHPLQLVEYSQTPNDMNISFDDPIKLVLLFDKEHTVNELYWVCLLKADDQRYVLFIYYGSIGVRNTFAFALQDYVVKSQNISVEGSVFSGSSMLTLLGLTSTVLNGIATNITVLQGEQYQLRIMVEIKPEQISETVLNELSCQICTKTMIRPIKMCDTGHAVCEACSKSLARCPLCQALYSNVRNFALEAIAEKIDMACHFRERGCMEVVLGSDMDSHIRVCTFAHIDCPMDVCKWVGERNKVLQHFQDEHAEYLYWNGDPLEINCSKQVIQTYIISCFDHLLVFKYKISNHDIKFVAGDLLHTDDDFKIELKMLNNENKVVWSMTMPCDKILRDFKDPMLFCSIPKLFYELYYKQPMTIQIVINIFISFKKAKLFDKNAAKSTHLHQSNYKSRNFCKIIRKEPAINIISPLPTTPPSGPVPSLGFNARTFNTPSASPAQPVTTGGSAPPPNQTAAAFQFGTHAASPFKFGASGNRKQK